MNRPGWMTTDLIQYAHHATADGLTIREMAAQKGLTYHKARELARAASGLEPDDGWTTTVVLGDVHIPFHDEKALGLVLQFIEETQPHRVIINGDFLDCYKVSTFSKDPSRGEDFHSELAMGREILARLRGIAPDAEIIYITGNHEHRLHRYICDNAGALMNLKGLTIPEQLELDELEIEWIPCNADKFTDTYIRMGELLVGHFAMTRAHSGYTAKNLLDRYGKSLIQAHVHSMGSCNKTLEDGPVMAWEGGCLCDLDPHYCRPVKWMHGFMVVHQEPDGTFFHVEPVQILDHKFHYGGKLWTA